MELKQGVALKVPVRLVAVVDGATWTGITYNQVAVTIAKQGGAPYQKVLSSSDWTEIDSVNMPGQYWLDLAASDVDTLGFLLYTVSMSLALPYPGLMQVVANLAADLAAYLLTAMAMLQRTLGLQFENAVQDQQEYDSNGKLTSCRLRLYDTRGNALTAGAPGLLATYAVEATFDATGAAMLFRMTRTS